MISSSGASFQAFTASAAGVPLSASGTAWTAPEPTAPTADTFRNNSGNWLTQSGVGFNFGASGSVFPFLPPLPHSQHAQAPISDDHSLAGSPSIETNMPHPGRREQRTEDIKLSSSGVTIPTALKPHIMSPFFLTSKQSVEQPMVFWRLATCELISCNEAFIALLDHPVATIMHGFLWTNIGVVDQQGALVSLQDSTNNALKAVLEFNQMVVTGNARYSQISFSFISGKGKLRHMHATMVAVGEDVLWLCSELGADPPTANTASVNSASSSSTTTTVRPINRKRSPASPARESDSAEANSPLSPSIAQSGNGNNDRKLVKVATRKKKPWDQNLVKFSLKKTRKRSKRARSQSDAT